MLRLHPHNPRRSCGSPKASWAKTPCFAARAAVGEKRDLKGSKGTKKCQVG